MSVQNIRFSPDPYERMALKSSGCLVRLMNEVLTDKQIVGMDTDLMDAIREAMTWHGAEVEV